MDSSCLVIALYARVSGRETKRGAAGLEEGLSSTSPSGMQFKECHFYSQVWCNPPSGQEDEDGKVTARPVRFT